MNSTLKMRSVFFLMTTVLVVKLSYAKQIYQNVSFITDEELKTAELTPNLDIENHGKSLDQSNGAHFEGDILLPKKLKSNKKVRAI
jgi:hypothetical protein